MRSLVGIALASAALTVAGGLFVLSPHQEEPPPPIPIQPVAAATELRLTGFTLANDQVYGGHGTRATVTFSKKTPTKLTVKLTARGLKTPLTATIKPGTRSTSFWIRTRAVTKKTPRTLRATYGKTTLTRKLTLLPLPTLQSLTLSVPKIAPGGSAVGTLRLTGKAQPGGSLVSLSSTSAKVTVPPSVRVPAGEKSARFRITSATDADSQTVKLSATRAGKTRTTALRIERPTPAPSPHATPPPSPHPTSPPSPVPSATPSTSPSPVPSATPTPTPQVPEVPIAPQVSGLMVGDSIVHLDETVTGTVTLDRPAPAGGTVVRLEMQPESQRDVVGFPDSVLVPEGKSCADFAVVNRLGLGSDPAETITLTASAGGATVEQKVLLWGHLKLGGLYIMDNTVTSGKVASLGVVISGESLTDTTFVVTFSGDVSVDPIEAVFPARGEMMMLPFFWNVPEVSSPTPIKISVGEFSRTIQILPRPTGPVRS